MTQHCSTLALSRIAWEDTCYHGPAMTPIPSRLQIGAHGWQNNFFDGRIDDVQVYKRVLSDAEVAGMVGLNGPFDKP